MYEYIKGNIAEINPAEVVLENNNIGYKILISLQTYSKIEEEKCVKLYIYHHVREDVELLYGFADKEEREVFTLLISVSGIGTNTARMMLSSMSSDEIRNAIVSEDVNKIKAIKGIGVKTAQRVIIDLKDKIVKGVGESSNSILNGNVYSPAKAEAASALILLGFNKAAVEKVLDGITKEFPASSLEDLIKIGLKRL